MKVNGKEESTGKAFAFDATEITDEDISQWSTFEFSQSVMKRQIDNLSISADAKVAIHSFMKVTLQVGNAIVKIGRKIIDIVLYIYKQYPNASFGLLFGAIAGVLVAGIPVLGIILGGLTKSLLMLFGLGVGLKEDLKDKVIARKIAEKTSSFEHLKA